MPSTADLSGDADGGGHDGARASTDPAGVGGAPPTRIPRIGVWSWSFVGAVVAAAIVVTALGAVSEIVLPLTFAAVLAICFKPLAGILQQHRVSPSLASGLIVLGLLALIVGIVLVTVNGVVEQMDQIGESADAALEKLADQLEGAGIDQAALDDARAATEGAAPMATDGFATKLVEGVGSVVGIVSGIILGALIAYYLLKDGNRLRRSVVAQFGQALRGDVDGFIGDSCRILRDYGKGRSVMSGVVAVTIGLAALVMGLPLVFSIMVVNFVGGYIPYIGAFLGGGLAVIVALGDGGFPQAAIMLVIVLAANLALENFVEPKVMGQSLDIHPLIVLVATALGGLLGGIVGLILAVPAYVIARSAIDRFRSHGIVDMVADKAQPAVQKLLE